MTSNCPWIRDLGPLSFMWSQWYNCLSLNHLTYSTATLVLLALAALAFSKFQGTLCFLQGPSHVLHPQTGLPLPCPCHTPTLFPPIRAHPKVISLRNNSLTSRLNQIFLFLSFLQHIS